MTMSNQEIFNQAIQESEPDEIDGHNESGYQESGSDENEGRADEGRGEEPSFTLDHKPTRDDTDEYWRAFAESKGWKSDAEGISEGDRVGYKAFVRNYEGIQSNIDSKSELKEMRRQMQEVLEAQREMVQSAVAQKQSELDKTRNELLQIKEKAKKELDFETYEKADEHLGKLDEEQAKANSSNEEERKAPSEQKIFVDFRNDNPELLEGSESFDADLNQMVEIKVNTRIREFLDRYGVMPLEDDIQTYLDDSLKSAKSNFIRYSDQPAKRTPPSTNSAKGGSKKVSLDPAKLSDLDRGMYDFYLKKDMKEVAERFLKSALGA